MNYFLSKDFIGFLSIIIIYIYYKYIISFLYKILMNDFYYYKFKQNKIYLILIEFLFILLFCSPIFIMYFLIF